MGIDDELLDDFRPPRSGFMANIRSYLPLSIAWMGIILTLLFNGYFDLVCIAAVVLASIATLLGRTNIVFWILLMIFMLSLIGLVTLFPGRLFIILPLEAMSLTSILFLFYVNESYVKQITGSFLANKKYQEQNAHYQFYKDRYASKTRAELKAIANHKEMSTPAKNAARDLLEEEE